MDAAVIKLDALTDADGTAANGDQTLFGSGGHVGQHVDASGTVRLVSGVVVRSLGRKFSRTGVDHTIDGVEMELVSALHHGPLVLAGSQGFQPLGRETGQRIGDVGITEPVALPQAKFLFGQLSGRHASVHDAALHLRQTLETVEEPPGDAGDLVDLLNAPAASKRFQQRSHASVAGDGKPVHQRGIGEGFVRPLGHSLTFGFIGSCERTRVGAALLE